MTQRHLIAVAGGSGTRMGAELPKQFLTLLDRPLLMVTLDVFARFDPDMNLILVLPHDHISLWNNLCEKHQFTTPHTVATGGKTRFHSVKNGLDRIQGGGVVGVHDGVRPLVTHETIARCYSEAEEHGNAIPAMKVTESVRTIDGDTTRPVNRDQLRIIQTPQCFQVELLKKAFNQEYQPGFTDDASVIEAMGETVRLVEGNRENVKITTPEDLYLARVLFSA